MLTTRYLVRAVRFLSAGAVHANTLVEIFKLHLYDCHCRHIFFGCSHDNGYARLLEDVADRPNLNRITLLEGIPFERELAMLKSQYKTTRFQGLFRTTKINVYQQHYPSGLGPPKPQAEPSLLPLPPPQYQSPYQHPVARTPSASNSTSMNPMATSWASTAHSAPAQVATPPHTPQPTISGGTVIPRNRHGQRVDPPSNYDKIEVKRVQKLKMCMVHYLREDCLYGDSCIHRHDYKPNKNEMQTLRYVARMTPCKFGSPCDDFKCIYGHR